MIRSRLARVGVELLAVLIVISASFMVLGSIFTSSWLGVFFYNGDSIVLPLVQQSIARGDPFRWVFSTQSFLFPEAVIYGLSYAVSQGTRAALTINAVLNVAFIYLCFRALVGQLLPAAIKRGAATGIATFLSLLFLGMVLAERHAEVNQSGLATPLLLTTYYYGATLSSLILLVLVSWSTRGFTEGAAKRSILCWASLLALAVSGLTTFSDPLFVVQGVAPLLVTLVVIAALGLLRWTSVPVVAAPTIVGVALGFVARRVWTNLFPVSLTQYVAPANMTASIHKLHEAFDLMLASAPNTVELCTVAVLVLIAVICAVKAVRQRVGHELSQASGGSVFINVFVSVSAVSLVAGTVLTGTTTPRYLQPITVYSVLVMIPLALALSKRIPLRSWRSPISGRPVLIGFGVVALLTAGGALVVSPKVAAAVSGAGYRYTDCLDHFLAGSSANGVGTYWASRPLDLYGNHEGVVLQVSADLTPFRWMTNLGAYADRHFSYVVIDSSQLIPVGSLESLGAPSQVVTCPDYQIWDYAGTRGEVLLNRTIHTAVESDLSSYDVADGNRTWARFQYSGLPVIEARTAASPFAKE